MDALVVVISVKQIVASAIRKLQQGEG